MTDLNSIIARVRELSEAATRLRTWCVTVRDDDTAQVYATSLGPCRMCVPIAETTPELAPLIAEYRTAAPLLADECERLRERVRVLESDYDDGGAATNRELARRLLAAEKRAMVLEAALRPFAHGCIRIDGGDELNAPTDPDCCRYCKARAALEGIESP